jgi:hypothetical protein
LCGFPSICPKLISRASRSFGFPMLLLTVEGPKAPLSRKLFGFVALRCYAEECAFSLSTQAQDHVWDLAEYKRVEPAHCPTGATSGGTGCERSIMLKRKLKKRFDLAVRKVGAAFRLLKLLKLVPVNFSKLSWISLRVIFSTSAIIALGVGSCRAAVNSSMDGLSPWNELSAASIAGWPGMAVSPGKATGTVVSDAASMIFEEALRSHT